MSRVEFEKYFKLNDEVEEKINMFGTPVQSISDKEIEIEVYPNRPDLLGLHGFLRSFKNFAGSKPEIKEYRIKKDKDFRVVVDSSVNSVRPYTVCAVIKGIKFDENKLTEIIEMQEKLHSTIGRNRKKAAIGIYPLDKIKFPVKYHCLSPNDIKFIPLGESKEMSGIEIIKRHPKGKEYGNLIEGFSKYPIFSDAENVVMSMPPIINSSVIGEVSENTKDIFIECSGNDIPTLKKIINIVSANISDMGGEIYSVQIDYKDKKIITPDFKEEVISFEVKNANKLLGLELKEKDVQKLLLRMGLDFNKGKVKVPSWRVDIMHEVDVIEDIAIAYGYKKFVPEIPSVATIGNELFSSKIKSKISEILAGAGLLEISSYHMIKPEEAKFLNSDDKIFLENSKTDYKILRENLLIPCLRIISENKDNEYPQKMFEIGSVFSKDKNSETGIKESDNLCLAITPGNFTEVKRVLEYLVKSLGFSLDYKEGSSNLLIDGRTASVILDGKEIGFIGEVHPEILRDFGIKMQVSLAEINLEKIFEFF